jgi:hypothetical protein
MKKERDVRWILLLIIILIIAIFFIILSFQKPVIKDGKNQSQSEINWTKIDETRWIRTNLSCLESNPIDYLCRDNCYTQENIEVWQACQDKMTAFKISYSGINFLCFRQSCSPEIQGGNCQVICPL